jgi:hypothetical protein
MAELWMWKRGDCRDSLLLCFEFGSLDFGMLELEALWEKEASSQTLWERERFLPFGAAVQLLHNI